MPRGCVCVCGGGGGGGGSGVLAGGCPFCWWGDGFVVMALVLGFQRRHKDFILSLSSDNIIFNFSLFF